MGRQGRDLSGYEVERIVHLLTDPQMSMRTIAKRMGCSTSSVDAVNKKFGVREYKHGPNGGWSQNRRGKKRLRDTLN